MSPAWLSWRAAWRRWAESQWKIKRQSGKRGGRALQAGTGPFNTGAGRQWGRWLKERGEDGWGGRQVPELGHPPVGSRRPRESLSGGRRVVRGLSAESLDRGEGAGWYSWPPGCPPCSSVSPPTCEQCHVHWF